MRRALVAVAALVGGLLLLGGAPARAQDSDSQLGIRQVDSTDAEAVSVTFFYTGERDDLADLTVREDDRIVDASSAVPLDDQQALGVVLVIDSSLSMEENALIERVRDAANQFVDDKAVTDQIAIVNFDGDVTLAQDFTTDEDLLHEAIDGIALQENTALWDGIVRSAHLFDDSTLQPNLLVFSDGQDNASSATAEQAEAAAQSVGAAVFAVGVENPGFARLSEVAIATGGASSLADDPAGVGALFEEVQQTLRKQYVTTFASTAQDAGAIPITLTVGNASDTKEYVPGSNQAGAGSLEPVPVDEPAGPGFLRSTIGLAIGLGLITLAAVAIAFFVGTAFF
ncbi:MAG: VWA domain-containing protein, partial [Acidimicrobiales bacterium]